MDIVLILNISYHSMLFHTPKGDKNYYLLKLNLVHHII